MTPRWTASTTVIKHTYNGSTDPHLILWLDKFSDDHPPPGLRLEPSEVFALGGNQPVYQVSLSCVLRMVATELPSAHRALILELCRARMLGGAQPENRRAMWARALRGSSATVSAVVRNRQAECSGPLSKQPILTVEKDLTGVSARRKGATAYVRQPASHANAARCQ